MSGEPLLGSPPRSPNYARAKHCLSRPRAGLFHVRGERRGRLRNRESLNAPFSGLTTPRDVL